MEEVSQKRKLSKSDVSSLTMIVIISIYISQCDSFVSFETLIGPLVYDPFSILTGNFKDFNQFHIYIFFIMHGCVAAFVYFIYKELFTSD